MSNTEIVEQFYMAFSEKNADKMIGYYDDNIVFEDPAFGELQGNKAKSMWKMLLSNNNDIVISYSNIIEEKNIVTAHWTAEYIFSKTGRKVINNVFAKFEFENGKIIKHTDTFNLHKWSSQAMGLKGYLLGWTSFFKNKLQKQTNFLLDKFISKN